jgi:magnesium-transporting ATPase (P-type)
MALGIVVATGVNTEAGKLSANLFSAEEPITPLRKKLNMLGKILVVTASAFSTLFSSLSLLSLMILVFVSALVIAIGAAWGKNVNDLIKLGVRFVRL